MMREDAWKTYESWRGLWLSGGNSNAIAALRFHGLRGALAMAGAGVQPHRPAAAVAFVHQGGTVLSPTP